MGVADGSDAKNSKSTKIFPIIKNFLMKQGDINLFLRITLQKSQNKIKKHTKINHCGVSESLKYKIN